MLSTDINKKKSSDSWDSNCLPFNVKHSDQNHSAAGNSKTDLPRILNYSTDFEDAITSTSHEIIFWGLWTNTLCLMQLVACEVMKSMGKQERSHYLRTLISQGHSCLVKPSLWHQSPAMWLYLIVQGQIPVVYSYCIVTKFQLSTRVTAVHLPSESCTQRSRQWTRPTSPQRNKLYKIHQILGVFKTKTNQSSGRQVKFYKKKLFSIPVCY